MAKAQAVKKTKKGSDFFSKIAGLKKGAKIAILVAGIVAAIAVFYMLYYTPWEAQVATLTREVASLNEQIKTETANINKHKPIADYIQPVTYTYSYLKSFLTTENEIPRLIEIISELGAQAGARVTLFAPKAAVPLADYAEIQFSMNLEGGFLSVLKFFYALSQMDRLINITSVQVDSPLMTETLTMLIKVKCQGSTYRELTPDEIQLASQKKK
ncbi:MAG: type 4a pilus biogenesis protein PilO [Deltaproteobacteria bacterium]|jgi:type IV pilus assembly protein PilO|nr:type 4a pilus biogenesis protein PilO [Deltaproteobacteria bacterium]